MAMSGVFKRLVGQSAVEAELLAAARAARRDAAHSDAAHTDTAYDTGHTDAPDGTMTHAWLITGPPGSGRSVAALCFAAALQCTASAGDGGPGCGRCRAPRRRWREQPGKHPASPWTRHANIHQLLCFS